MHIVEAKLGQILVELRSGCKTILLKVSVCVCVSVRYDFKVS